MRQIMVQVEQGKGEQVLQTARDHQAINLSCHTGTGPDGAVDLVVLHISNDHVGRLIDDLEEIGRPHVTLQPRGVLALQPPATHAPAQVAEVNMLSPLEVLLAAIQSVGSWRGFLGYAGVAGVVVWVGLFTNTIYLLVAAMFIAPFAGPAMNAAIATARGDLNLLGRSLLRYAAALGTTVVVCYVLSLILRQDVATQTMVAVSEISSVTVLLPLAAGAAGALNLVQSERSSLVSGAATGMLVAASLAPPAGLVGMGIAIGEWAMVKSALFLLLLQLIGINLSGAALFRLFGLTPGGPRYARGRSWLSYVSWGATLVLLAGLLTWQFWTTPQLQRSSLEQRAAADVRQAINDSGVARLVDATVEFTRADIPDQNTLLVLTYVVPTEPAASDETIRQTLTTRIQQRLADYNLTPAISITVLQTPTSPSANSEVSEAHSRGMGVSPMFAAQPQGQMQKIAPRKRMGETPMPL